MDVLVEINRLLDGWLLRYRQQRAMLWSIRGLLIGQVFWIGFSLWGIPNAELLFMQYLQFVLVSSLGFLLVAGMAGFLWPIQRLDAIRSFDRRFHLQERISTAVEFSASGDVEPALFAEQRRDALEHGRQVDIRAGLPWKMPWLELGFALILVIVIAGMSIRNQPYFLAAMQKQDLKKNLQTQSAELEELQSNIQRLENLTTEQRDALKQPIEEAARRLESAQSLEEAMSALNQAEQDLQALSPADVKERTAGLRQAGQSISSRDGSALEPFGENLAQGEYLQAAQALESVDPSTLSADQQRNLAGDLQAAAEALSGSDPELAQNLQNAAEALQSGDAGTAAQALAQAAQTLQSQEGELNLAEAASQAASQLNASQQNLAQAGPTAQAQASSGLGQTTSAQNSSQGNGNSAGASTNGGDSGGSGSGQGESQGNENSGGQAGTQPIDTSNQPGDGGERPYESIYTPERLTDEPGQEVVLPGSDQPGNVIGQVGQAPGTPNQSLTPYVEVYPAYESAVRQAIESGQIPQHLQALVRDYFSSLAP